MNHRLRLDRRDVGTTLLLLYAIAVVVALALGVGPHLLQPSGGSSGGLSEFINKINSIKGPATAAMASLSGIGLLLGGCLLALGQQTGARIMALAACAGGGVLLGNGLIA